MKLIETFVDKAEDLPHLGKQFVPPMMDPVLGDYARNVPDARESEVLSLFATIINKYCLEFDTHFSSRWKHFYYYEVSSVNSLGFMFCYLLLILYCIVHQF